MASFAIPVPPFSHFCARERPTSSFFASPPAFGALGDAGGFGTQARPRADEGLFASGPERVPEPAFADARAQRLRLVLSPRQREGKGLTRRHGIGWRGGSSDTIFGVIVDATGQDDDVLVASRVVCEATQATEGPDSRFRLRQTMSPGIRHGVTEPESRACPQRWRSWFSNGLGYQQLHGGGN